MQLKYDVYAPHYINSGLAPVVLLHSMLETRKTWLRIAPEIMKLTGRKVYAVDARNHGESPWTNEYSIEAMTDDLEEFLRQNGIKKVVLVGHSMGGKVSIQYAFRKPQSVEKLIIEDSTPKNFVVGGGRTVNLGMNVVKEFNTILGNLEKEEAIANLKNVMAMFDADLGATKEKILDYDFRLLPLEWKGNSFSLQLNIDVLADAMINNRLQQNLPGAFEGDVLLLYGKKSQFKIGSDEEFLKYLPRTKKVEFENAAHFIHHVYPKEFTQEVVNFINKGTILEAKY